MKSRTLVFLIILTLVNSFAFGQTEINQYDSDGKRDGLWRKNFDETNQPRYEGEFRHGKEIGIFKFYKLVDNKSVLSATKEFNLADNAALVKFFSSTGKLISEGKMVDKAFVGKWVYYHNKTNAVMTVENYNNQGQLNGERLVYYENGQMAEKANYVNGKKEGLSVWYADNGKVLKELMYKNDELNGRSKAYDVKGELAAEGEYRNGRQFGQWKYYTDGKLTKEKTFDPHKQ